MSRFCCLIHRLCSPLRVLHHFHGLLPQELFLLGFGNDGDAMRFAVVILIEVGEGRETIGSNLFGFSAAVHLRVNRQGATTYMDDLALESDDVAREDGELEVNAVQYEQNGVLGVNILRHSEIGTLQEVLGAATCEEGLVVVEVGEFD